jgi:hypothetical protein
MLLKQLNQILEAPQFKVDDAVEVKAGHGDGYGEKGVILEIKDDKAHVEFEAGYKKWVELRHLMTCKRMNEARDPQLTYHFKEVKGKVDRIIVKLEGKKSEIFTKLAKRYKELDNELKALEVRRDELNAETKEKTLDYFNAEDEVLTRVVETVSMTATMSKLSQPSPKVDHEAVVAALVKLMPELTDKVRELEASFSTTPKPKSPALSVKTNEGVADLWAAFKKKASALLAKFKVWGKSYDEKLANVKTLLSTPVTEGEFPKKDITPENVLSVLPGSRADILWQLGHEYYGKDSDPKVNAKVNAVLKKLETDGKVTSRSRTADDPVYYAKK